MTLSRKTLIGTFALAATLSAPLAFAQSQTDAASTGTSAQAIESIGMRFGVQVTGAATRSPGTIC